LKKKKNESENKNKKKNKNRKDKSKKESRRKSRNENRKGRETKGKGILVKLHERRDAHGVAKRVLAVCDEELLGKVFTAKNRVLDLKTYAAFYNGAKTKNDEVVKLMRSADNLNLVGKRSIELAKKAFSSLNEKNVRKIKGIPHLQLYKI